MRKIDKLENATVVLHGVGNPDFRQFSDVSPRQIVPVSSLKEARTKCLEYIEEWDLGFGNWGGGQVKVGKKKVAYVSYNGRVWDPTEKEELSE